MSTHSVRISWKLGSNKFEYPAYSRNHQWDFPAGSGSSVLVEASAAREYLGDENKVDPEQAFVASIASCHMLTFLAIASRRRLRVLQYSDNAVGWLEKNDDQRLAITRVELQPTIVFDDPSLVSGEMLDKLHHQSHKECFIANSVQTKITVVGH